LPLYSSLKPDQPLAKARSGLRNEYGHAAHLHCNDPGRQFSAAAPAQSLRPAYAPDGRSQSAQSTVAERVIRPQKVTSIALKTARSRAALALQSDSAIPTETCAASPAVPSSSNRSLNDFFATIFAGPMMLAHAFRPGQSTYYAPSPVSASLAYGSPAYMSPNQTDPRDAPIDPRFLRQEVAYPGREAPGTIIIDTANKLLYLIEDGGRALRYGIGVGRPGFLWAGVKTVTAKREWPDWRPPVEMLARRPDLPRFMPGGIDNPLGARPLSWFEPLSHPWLERALDHRHQCVVRLYPYAQRGCHGPLSAREGRYQSRRDLEHNPEKWIPVSTCAKPSKKIKPTFISL
jgi:lipoprotein-anchoring transpeptidase ErfK/SrfK